MVGNEIKTLQAIRDEEPGLKEPGTWYVINIVPRMAWPIMAQSFYFEEHEIWIVPVTESAYPGLAVRNPSLDSNEASAMLYRALSLISWLKDGGVVVEGHGGGSPLFPIYGNQQRTNMILQDTFDLMDLPVLESESAKLALALMREGRGLNHPAYSFLSFYRIVELAFPKGKARGVWMADAIGRIQDHRAEEALSKLADVVDGDIAEHLRESGRNAVAHAKLDPIANPDNPSDYQRLRRESPIIEALATMAIEEVFDVKTSHTIWNEHLYELRGWQPIFGSDLIALITEGKEPAVDRKINLPYINLRLRRSEKFEPLENLKPIGWDVCDSKAHVQYLSVNGLVTVNLSLDFKSQRLIFPLEDGLQFIDDGTVEAAKTGKILTEFNHAYNGNGELQVWNNDDGSLMSKCDAFIPVNVIFNPKAAEAELDRWNREIARRAMAQQKV
jgi:Methylamine utilization protein MauJ